jgi:hypothetical protein
LEKFRGVFAKFQGPGIFPELLNYFSIEKSVNRVHNTGSRARLMASLNRSHRFEDLRFRLEHTNVTGSNPSHRLSDEWSSANPASWGGATVVTHHGQWRPHRSFAPGAVGHGSSGFLAQIHVVDTRILTRWSWTMSTVPRRLAAAVTPLQALGSE